jgi:hypothetical protein
MPCAAKRREETPLARNFSLLLMQNKRMIPSALAAFGISLPIRNNFPTNLLTGGVRHVAEEALAQAEDTPGAAG